MSIVAVHGPQTFGSKAITEVGAVYAVVNPTNGLKWDFNIDGSTTRSAQDFSWAFPTDGTPSPQTVANPTEVTYATPGTKTATLTVTNTVKSTINNKALTNNVATIGFSAPHGFAAGQRVTITGTIGAPFLGTWTLLTASGSTMTFACTAADVTSAATTGTATSASDQYPTAGAYPIPVNAASGAPGPSLMMAPGGDEGGEELPITDEPDEPDIPVGYDPAAHTVEEVKQFVMDHPDEAQDIYDAEVAGKNRSTLLAQLEAVLTEPD